jgi:2'-5' RNA ligase
MGVGLTTILTLEMDAVSQARFEAMRQKHYPAELNRIAAHLTLFHTLPASDAVRDVLTAEAAAVRPFRMRVTGVRSLGRGVAFGLESSELVAMRARLARVFENELSAQDRQGFRPHVVVQNKVSAEEAKGLVGELSAGFAGWNVQAVGLGWWDYLGGPWERRGWFGFGGVGT